ncbi:sigma-54-dependent Fis family transcriptional regulator [Trinickia sp. LjRoot230]|uniref:sigma-54-dependent Fis family transcriptional regulator n=1 Tax=Trinickia sp. LjRoot230 TaxID=3342288 RepID=UPI003ED06F68
MPYPSQVDHINRIMAVIEGRSSALEPPSHVVSSWRRALERHQLAPDAPIRPRALTAAELREAQGKAEAFLRASSQSLVRLHDVLGTDGYGVMLTNANGVAVDCRIGPDVRDDFKRAGMHLGSCWTEDEMGTAGVPTVLADLRPMTVHRDEHFSTAFLTAACSAAPIFAPTGELLGVLDASALQAPKSRDDRPFVLRTVTQAARIIENEYLLERTANHWVLAAHKDRHYVDALPAILIAFDESGNIVCANRHARPWVTGHGGALRHIDELFVTSHAYLRDIARTDALIALQLRENGTTVYARLRAPRQLLRVATAAPIGKIGAAEPGDSLMQRFFLSSDERIASTARLASRIAGKRISILVTGETGAGKEVFARAIHASGPRCGKPFVAVNCGAIPEQLIESELFGYLPGAFTGARSKGARGKIASADSGTLFLDEIGDMPLSLQTRLLRVLADGEVTPLGSDSPTRVDVDVICATHRNLSRMVADGTFREDLYYRLAGATFNVPPLRERTDIRDVIDAVFREEAESIAPALTLDASVIEGLCTFPWPGNVRQLRNVLRYACAVCESGNVELRHLPRDLSSLLALRTQRQTCSLRADAADERARIVAALALHDWKVQAATRALGMSRATLYRRMAALGIVAPHRAS